MKKNRFFLLLLLLTLAGNVESVAQTYGDSLSTSFTEKKKKKSFGQKLLTPVMWIARNWNDYDPKYSLPSFYNWAGQVQNTTSFEWLRMETPEGMDIEMNSRISNRIGPYFGWRWIFFGTTIDLNGIGKPKTRKDEFTLSINSALFNIDLIRRRTGGDFKIKKMVVTDPIKGDYDISDLANSFDLGDYIKNSITGVNINYFTNHKKYSNPAAFSNGSVQLRSVGSPIIGAGFTHQKIESNISELFSTIAGYAIAGSEKTTITEDEIESLDELWENNQDAYFDKVGDMLDRGWPVLKSMEGETNIVRTFMTNHFPTITTINDWHLQLGYTYNLVFSRRLLLGLSAIVSPGIKHVHADNRESFTYMMADRFTDLIRKHEGREVDPDYFRYDYDDTHFNLNLFARASLTYNNNRWRAGVNASFSNYLYNNKGMTVNNGYGNIAVYVSYSFGRKREFRYNGMLRDEYIRAALTKKQIEEMKDTMPKSNLKGLVAPTVSTVQGKQVAKKSKKTRKYHTDVFNIDVFGCDLVAGPDGRYGWFEVQDGYVTEGQDTEGRLSVGKVLEVDKTGRFHCEAGHDKSFRAGNWWKSQLSIDQIPNHWYPEMLHYAFRGKLTLYLRGRVFGTKKPVKLELEDVCINHGKETKSFFQIGIKSFRSNSAYSIEGMAEINGKPCRIYIEQKQSGKLTNMYVSRIYAANSNWMAQINDERPISTISMPGTHDAGTSTIPEQPAAIFRAAHTQNFSVPSQFADGIRAFDIRLKKNLQYGHTLTCRDSFDSTMVAWDQFLTEHPTEFIVAMIGSDEGGKWDSELKENFSKLIAQYPHRFVEDFSPATPIKDVRGKILVIRRQEDCPFGKLLKFTDNAIFEYNGFCVEDIYNEHKTYKKAKIVEQHLRDAYENDDPNKWYITFNSIAWSPRRHNPYSYAWGGRAKNIRKPMNKNLREFIDLKDYTDFGIVFLDFYNDHGDNPQIVETIIDSNFHRDEE